MAQQRLHPHLAALDIPSTEEHDKILTRNFDMLLRDRYRTIKPIRSKINQAPVAGSYTLSGPDSGFSWELKTIGVMFSAETATGNVFAWLGDTAGQGAPFGTAPIVNDGTYAAAVISWGSHAFMIHGGENVTLSYGNTNSLAGVTLFGIEVAAEMIAKLVG